MWTGASNLSHSLHVKISMYILVLDDQFVLLTNMFCFVARAESIEALMRDVSEINLGKNEQFIQINILR